MTDATTPAPQLNRAGRRAESRRLRKTGAVMAAIPAAFGTTALLLGATALPAGADTLTVTNLTDNDPGSLRDILATASDGDTIVFQAGLTGDIDLITELTVDASVTIQGPGADVVAIDGQDTVRIFNISTEGGATGNVTISGLTLKDGSAGGGGAILNANENIVIDGVAFESNESSDDGGAIHSGNGTSNDLTIRNSSFTDNTAVDYGGAIRFNDGALEISDTTFRGNTADNSGGAIYAGELEGPVTITRSSFSDNSGYSGGAAAIWYSSDAEVRIEESEFVENRAEGEDGGALYLYDLADVTIAGSVFTGNYADEGGGAITQSGGLTGDFRVESSTVDGNTASDDGGGGLYVYGVDGDVVISATTIVDNETDGGGGGAFIKEVGGDFVVESSVIADNTSLEYGGGLYVSYVDGESTISFTTVAGNTATDSGGGIEWYRNTGLTLRNSTLSGNTAGGWGGGIYVSDRNYETSVGILNSTISGNTAGEEGGGISFASYYGLDIVQSTITANTATTIGGVFINDDIESVGAAKADATVADTETAGGKGEPQAPRVQEDRVRATAFAPVFAVGSIVSGNAGADIGSSGVVEASGSLLGTVTGTALEDKGGNLFGVDPLLGALQDNGGPTQTHALLDGSPAINAGPDPVPDFPGNTDDQRGPGYPRVVGGRVDIGAFEVQPTNLEPTFTG